MKLEQINKIKSATTIKSLYITYNDDGKIASIKDDLNRVCNIAYLPNKISITYRDLYNIELNIVNNNLVSVNGLISDFNKTLTIEQDVDTFDLNFALSNKYIKSITTPYNEKIEFNYFKGDTYLNQGAISCIKKYINNNIISKNEFKRYLTCIKSYHYKFNNSIHTKEIKYGIDEFGKLNSITEYLNNSVVSSQNIINDSYKKNIISTIRTTVTRKSKSPIKNACLKFLFMP